MNLLTVPLGGMPVCHGAGGLAAQYHFGARTGGAVVLLGGLKVVGGLALLALPAAAVTAFPRPLLGALLLAAGWRLATAARAARGSGNVAVAVLHGGSDGGAGNALGRGGGGGSWRRAPRESAARSAASSGRGRAGERAGHAGRVWPRAAPKARGVPLSSSERYLPPPQRLIATYVRPRG